MHPKHKDAKIFKNPLNPAMLVFFTLLLLSTLRWVPMCQGFCHFLVWEQIWKPKFLLIKPSMIFTCHGNYPSIYIRPWYGYHCFLPNCFIVMGFPAANAAASFISLDWSVCNSRSCMGGCLGLRLGASALRVSSRCWWGWWRSLPGGWSVGAHPYWIPWKNQQRDNLTMTERENLQY